ncbi:TIGR03089 family protein [Rhodococcus spongiicola]|uniref:TIGR03089 family protein n=1 Tax=Rhodococcus spongiicola TaxID=2487352 RepID=A0A3S3AC49_9NOCA|nr:TIGR03089 family protein [Rhodococcus spongiicola]RVW04564.1 TIGR03089 family protein [Rhodococcus spongiicola]
MPNLASALLDPILAADPAGPRITYYDDATGERIELSAITLANWAAKTANFLCDEFALMPGARVSVLLPAHWQTAAVLLGAWWAGLEVTLDADPDADAALATADRLDDVADVPEVAILSLDAFGRPAADLPVGVTDYATAVRVHGDQFDTPGSSSAALDGRSADEVLSTARAVAAEQNVSGSDRVLSTRQWTTADDVVADLVSVLAVGASLVQVSNPDEAALARRIDTEKVTAQLDV